MLVPVLGLIEKGLREEIKAMKIGDIASYELHHLDLERLRESLDSEYTIKATREASAFEVASKSEATPGIVVVVDEANEPQAIVDPEELRRRLQDRMDIRTKHFRQALEEWATVPEEQKRHFRHEWVEGAYDPHWCEPGRHYTTLAPCPVHEV